MTPIPPIILSRHKHIVLDMDAVKVNGVRFFVAYSYNIKLCTTTELLNVEIPTLIIY